jgi:hypothetical protein
LFLDSLLEGSLWLCISIDFEVFAANSKDNLLVFVRELGACLSSLLAPFLLLHLLIALAFMLLVAGGGGAVRVAVGG